MAKYKDIELPDDLYYDRKEHIWVKVEDDDKVSVGMDKFAHKAAGNATHIKLKPKGRVIKGRALGSIEAGKYIGPLKSPINGTIIEVNREVAGNPKIINEDPHEAWFMTIEPDDWGTDSADLVHSEGVQAWLEEQYREYEEKGLFGD